VKLFIISELTESYIRNATGLWFDGEKVRLLMFKFTISISDSTAVKNVMSFIPGEFLKVSRVSSIFYSSSW